jgi:hypothetical protein
MTLGNVTAGNINFEENIYFFSGDLSSAPQKLYVSLISTSGSFLELL